MSLKAELERWAKALDCYDAHDFTAALQHFDIIADSSKVLFNIGLIHATLGNHRMAVAHYQQAHLLDQYMAVSFFQCGVSHFLLGEFSAAEHDFANAYVHMRENQIIDYEQLGLKFRLYSAEILFNRGLALINIGGSSSTSAGMQLLDSARREKQTPEHGVIDEAFATHGRDFTVFSVPVGVVFRPPAIKLRNLKAKNYLGTAKLVAATELADAFIGFSGTGVAPSKQASPSQSQSSTSSFKIGTGAEAAGGRAPALLTSTRMRSNSLSGDALASRPSKPPSPPPNVPLPAIPSGLAGLMNANISVVASDPRDTRDTSTIRPLRIQKSSPDLRAARGQAQHQQLPKLNTNVGVGVGQLYIQRDAAGARIAGAGGVYSTAPLAERTYAPSRNGSRTVGGSGNGDGNGNGTYIANAMMAPPSPPESDYGEPLALHNRSHSRDSPVYPKSGVASQQQQKQGSRRTSSDTTLIYRTSDARQQAQAQAYVQASAQGQDQDRGQGQSRGYARSKGPRETEFMEELIGGYSAVSPLPRDMLSPDNTVTASAVALTGPEPMPQGQSRDRVANWASTQAPTPVQSQREHDREQSRLNVNVHTNTSGGGLVRHGTGSSAQSSATGVVGVPGTRGANRRRAQTDGPAAQFLTSRYGDSAFDDALSALTVDMVSFRLKLHFEDDVRGMSLDVGTPYDMFYARLQAKFGISDMRLRYKDEDGTMVTIVDETDWDSAVDAAREHCPKGRQDGKLEIWVSEV